MDPRAGLEALKQRKSSHHYQESKHDSSVIQPAARDCTYYVAYGIKTN